MWCETEVKKALCFIPGYTGFYPEYSQQIGESYGQQTHHLMREHPHLESRLSNTGGRPCVRVEIKPDKLGRGDSEYEKCSTCTYERDVRPAGLPSADMWRFLDLEGQREQRAKEKKALSSPKNYYSRHESHYPSYYPHYEGFRDEHDDSHYDHGHHHHGHHGHGHHHQDHHKHGHHHQDHHKHGYHHHDHHKHGHHHQDHYKHGYHHQDHHKHGYQHQDHHDHGHNLNKHKGENPVSVSIYIIPHKPKGKFYVPSVCGDYDLEKNKVCLQLPDKHCRKGERSGDRKSCHNKEHVKLDQDYANNRYCYPETSSSDRDRRKSHCRTSSRNGAMPHYVGFIGGIQLCGPMNSGNSSRRMWRGNCC